MKILVDANIIFSAILNSNGKIGDLLVNSGKHYAFIAPDFLRYEIRNKYQRLQNISGMTLEQVQESEYQICKNITFISEEQITDKNWLEAFALVSDVDMKDVHYVAYAKQFRCKLWSGDKKLLKGLQNNGFTNFLTTHELFELRQKKLK